MNEQLKLFQDQKNSPSDVGVKISSVKGDITITVVKNGNVRISGNSVTIQADQDIDLKAGRNITLTAGSRVLLRGLTAQANALLGNLVHNGGSWLERILKPTMVGSDYLRNPPKDDKFLSKPVVED